MEDMEEQKSFAKSTIETISGALKYIAISVAITIAYAAVSSFIFDKPVGLGGIILMWIVSFIITLRKF